MELKPAYRRTQVGSIPEQWGCSDVHGIASSKRNSIVGGPFGSDLVSQDYVETGVPVIRGQNMGGQWISRNFVYVSPAKTKLLEANLAYPGDIIFTQRGTLGQVSIVPEKPFDSYLVSQSQMKLSVDQTKASALFYYYVFTSEKHQEIIRGETIQTGVPHINLGILRKIPVQIPPLSEQHAIAAALSNIDALLGKLNEIIGKKRSLKQATMQKLLTGGSRLPGFRGEWEVKRLRDCLISVPDYGINAAAVPFSDRLAAYIRITDISEQGQFCPDPRVSVDSKGTAQYYLREGDVVFARTGASVGKSYLYRPSDGELVFAGFLIRVRPDPKLLVPAFLAAYSTTKPYWDWVRVMSMRSGQPGINGNEYAQLPLWIPKLSEQIAIADVLSDMDAEIAALEARRDKTRRLKQGMMQELLTGRIRLI